MDTENRPVLTGLVALVGVAVVIGLLGGLAVIVGVKATGIGDSTQASDQPSTSATFRLPRPTDTSSETTPEEAAEPSAGTEPTSEAPATAISLSASQQSVSPMQQIDLTGTYATGEGAILQVQQKVGDGEWQDFPVTMTVSNQTFGGYIQTGQPGENTFRVIDTDKDVLSNEVVVTVG